MKSGELYIVYPKVIENITYPDLFNTKFTHRLINNICICKLKNDYYYDIFYRLKIKSRMFFCDKIGDLFAFKVVPLIEIWKKTKVSKKELKVVIDVLKKANKEKENEPFKEVESGENK